MFSVIDPFGQRQKHSNRMPCFIDIGPQFDVCHSGNRPFSFGNRHARNCCGTPGFEHDGYMNSPVVNILQRVLGETCGDTSMEQKKRQEKGNDTSETDNVPQRKRKSDTLSKAGNNPNKLQKEMDPPKPTVQDVINHAMSVFSGLQGVKDDGWREQIDCRGFDSKNIKIKIGSNELLLKAFRKQASGNGVQTMSMKRSVPLPENIDTKRIKCKLLSNGLLAIEAPYLDNYKNKNTLEFVNCIMTSMLPGLERLMRPNDSNPESQDKENHSDKCTDKSEEEREVCTETSEKEKESHETNESNRRDGDTFSEDKLEASDMKDDTPQTHCHDLGNMGKEPSVSNVESKDETNGNDVTHLTENDDCDDAIKHGVHHKETDSNSSDNSFVLLSELENEENIVIDEDLDQFSDDGSNDIIGNKETVNTDEEEATNDCEKDEITQPSVQNGNENNASTENRHCQYNECENKKDKVLFRLEMPSYNPESMKVTFDNTKRLLSISACKNQANPGAGIPPASITKTVAVDDDVDVTGLQCYFRDGTLTVTAPLKPTIRSIPIKA